jgi:probable phosphoglycerate mutase
MRHGETEWSRISRHTGRTDIALTENGQRQAAVLGQHLARTKFAAVLCSPLRRARETCEIAGFGAVAKVDEGLCEWDYGAFEGRTAKEIHAEIPDWSVWKDDLVGGESVEQVGARADGVIERALAAAGPATHDVVRVALFAHAHIFRILTARWIGLDARGGHHFVLATGSVSVLGFEKETRVIRHWNRGFEE